MGHEVYHLAHGPEEGPAYVEQIRLLRELGAPSTAIRAVETAKKMVVGAGNGATSGPVVR